MTPMHTHTKIKKYDFKRIDENEHFKQKSWEVRYNGPVKK